MNNNLVTKYVLNYFNRITWYSSALTFHETKQNFKGALRSLNIFVNCCTLTIWTPVFKWSKLVQYLNGLNLSGIWMVCLILWSDHLKAGQKSVLKSPMFCCSVFRWLLVMTTHRFSYLCCPNTWQMELWNATEAWMAVTVIFIDIWQQRTQKRTGFVIPFVIDILVTELPKHLT